MTELHDDLAKFFGWPPYDEPSNICRGDGYYALGLKRKYGESVDELLKSLLKQAEGEMSVRIKETLKGLGK